MHEGFHDSLLVKFVHIVGISGKQRFLGERSATSLSPNQINLQIFSAEEDHTAGSFEYSLKYFRFFGIEV
jgi:hypothetical protein